MEKIEKQDGFNDSEKYLAGLCEKTFLSLWSYPNVYTDEGKKSDKADGKELCDLLVVFDNHVILFSDKDIGFKDTGNIEVDWGRWVKKAVIKSANQLYGAESWIRSRPDRIYLDPTCKKKFPIDIPTENKLKVHRVAIAKNATEKFSRYTQGSCSLIVNPAIKGAEHLKNPFMIGIPIENKPYVHVFDDVALDIVMCELNTISDFIDYLGKKESLIESGSLISAAGEEEILAHFLFSSGNEKSSGFHLKKDEKIILLEGRYKVLKELPQYIRGKEYDRISYFWDAFIEHFSSHALGGTLIYNPNFLFSDAVLALKVMASERRVARRVLARVVINKINVTPSGKRAVRVIRSPTNPEFGYVWLAEPIPSEARSYDQYRDYRKELLYIYCTSAKLLYPSFKIIVGISTEDKEGGGGEDMIYLDTSNWTQKDFEQAENDRRETGILLPENIKQFEGTDYQYPILKGDYPNKKDENSSKENTKVKAKRIKKAQKKARKLSRKHS